MPTRAERILFEIPQLIADVTLCSTRDGGRVTPIQPGYGCPCFVSKELLQEGYDGFPLLREPLAPGESRRLGFIFLSGMYAANKFRKAGKFSLWEGKIIGEAEVVG